MISDSCYYPPRKTTFVVLIYASAMVVCITGRRVWVQQPSSWGSQYSGRGCPKPIEFSLEFHHRTSPAPSKRHVCKPLGSRLLFRVSAAPQLYTGRGAGGNGSLRYGNSHEGVEPDHYWRKSMSHSIFQSFTPARFKNTADLWSSDTVRQLRFLWSWMPW
jgi:hypothetical protein